MRIIMKLDTGFAGAVHEEEIDDPDLDKLTPEELAQEMEAYAQGMISNYIEVSWEKAE